MFVGLSFHNVIVGQTLYILDNAETQLNNVRTKKTFL